MTPAIFGISGLELTADERAFFKEADPAGYILFARNCETREQMRRLTDDLRSIHGREHLIISIDQEGGRVVRMKPPEWNRFPAGEAFDRLYQIAPASAIEAARVNAEAMARELAEVGVTVDYHAPFDVRRPETADAIGDRALGSEPMQVAALGRAVLDGMALAGVVGCLKHIPGHGRAVVDSHKELPVADASEEELEIDLEPFRTLATHPLGMTCHLLFPVWDKDNPATQSPTVIEDVIRGRIGFDGLLLTDDIDMEALEGTVPERSEKALAAGCDITLNAGPSSTTCMASSSAIPTCRGYCAATRTRARGNGPCTGQLRNRRTTRQARRAARHCGGSGLTEGVLFTDPAQDEAEDWDGIAADASADKDALYLELDGWEGPLDLLLDLARRQKVDLREISILALVKQYLDYIEQAEALKLELAADYLVMAAWLAYLKSSMLLPKEEQEDPSPEELALKLQLRLQRLGAMREAAGRLMGGDRIGRDVFLRGRPEGLAIVRKTNWQCDQFALIEAYGRVKARTAPAVHMVRERR